LPAIRRPSSLCSSNPASPRNNALHNQLNIVYALDLLGTAAFAASGALAGMRKRMDLLGATPLVIGIRVAAILKGWHTGGAGLLRREAAERGDGVKG